MDNRPSGELNEQRVEHMPADDTHRIVFLDRETLAPEVTLRRPGFAHTWTEHDRTLPGQVVERAHDATIVIDNKVPLRADTLEQENRELTSQTTRYWFMTGALVLLVGIILGIWLPRVRWQRRSRYDRF